MVNLAAASVQIHSPAIPDGTFAIHAFEGREALGAIFELKVDVIGDVGAELDEDAVLSKPARVVFLEKDLEVRSIFGVIVAIDRALDDASPHPRYRLLFAPRAFSLSLVETCEVFLDASLPEILAKKLEQHGLLADIDFHVRLRGAYPKRDIVVQYKETDLAFVSRLAEHYGVTFFYEHDTGKDVLVFSDDNSGLRQLEPTAVVAFTPRGHSAGVHHLSSTRRTVPANVVVKDYNYRTPGVPLLASRNVVGGKGQIVEHGGHFKTLDEAELIARVRAEEIGARHHVFSGKSVTLALEAGRRFTLDGHAQVGSELLLTEVHHRVEQAVFGFVASKDKPYENEFRAIAATVPFRPQRLTPKPRVAGSITGIVEASTTDDYADVDEHGRYHVRFQFDTGDASRGRASHLIRMAQPHAGAGYGFHFPLRDGVEVLLTCIDGDPDRPVITGAVPNPTTPSTVGSKNGMRNVIRTGGGNEINIDDRQDFQRIKFSTPYKNSFFQLGAPNHPTPGAVIGTNGEGKFISTEKMLIQSEAADAYFGSTGGDVYVGTTAGSVYVKATANVELRADARIFEQAPVIELVGDGNINLGAPWIDVHADSKLRAGAPVVEVNGDATVDIRAGGTLTLSGTAITIIDGGAAVLISSSSAIQLSAPAVSIKCSALAASGETVTVSGGTVDVTGSGTINIKGGAVNLNC